MVLSPYFTLFSKKNSSKAVLSDSEFFGLLISFQTSTKNRLQYVTSNIKRRAVHAFWTSSRLLVNAYVCECVSWFYLFLDIFVADTAFNSLLNR